MIIPVRRCLKVFGTDSFELTLTWKDSDGNVFDLADWVANMKFFISKEDRTLVKLVTSVGASSVGSRIDLSDVSPNIYVFIKSTETFVVDNISPAGGFDQTPGYYTLEVGPQDTQETMDRLMQGAIHYEL